MNYNVGNPYLILSLADYMSGNMNDDSAMNFVEDNKEIYSPTERRNTGAATWMKKLISNGRKLLETNAEGKPGCIEYEVYK